MTPLLGENRYLVSEGLKRMNSSPRLGLVELLTKAGTTAGALTSENITWTFNCGIGAMLGSSWLKALNEGNYAAVPGLMALYNKVEVNGKLEVCEGLINRRIAEVTLFKAV